MRDEIGTWQNKTKQLMLQVPGLPRKVTVDVTKCHACHTNSGGVHGANWEPSAPSEPAQCTL
jgi:hypothetical protein